MKSRLRSVCDRIIDNKIFLTPKIRGSVYFLKTISVLIKRLVKGGGANACVYAHPVRRGPLIGPRKRDIV